VSTLRRLALVLAIVLVGCATRQLSRTVGRGRTEFGLLVGGPLQSSLGGFTAPVPEHRVFGRVGLTDDLDLDASLPLGPLASAILAFDVALVAQALRLPDVAIATSVRLHSVFDLDDGAPATLHPEFGVHSDLRVDRRVAILLGGTALVQGSPPQGAPELFFAPYAGVEVLLGEHALALTLAWINPWDDSRGVIHWEPAGAGAIVVTFGWRIQPGGIR
jgi:hypothetical protein